MRKYIRGISHKPPGSSTQNSQAAVPLYRNLTSFPLPLHIDVIQWSHHVNFLHRFGQYPYSDSPHKLVCGDNLLPRLRHRQDTLGFDQDLHNGILDTGLF